MEEFFHIEKKLQDVLKKKRYAHTLGVRYTAAALAMRHGCSVEKAQMAGLLHDCAKGYSGEELLALASKYGLDISKAEMKTPHLLHAKVGAYLAEYEYGVTDEDILNAIRFHTTGKPGMTMLEKIVFIADYIEPNRRMLKGLPRCRALAFENLDVAMYEILKSTLEYLCGQEETEGIDETTRSAYEYYKRSVTV